MGCILRIGNNKIANKGVVRIFGCVFLLSAKFLGNRIRNIKSFRFVSFTAIWQGCGCCEIFSRILY